MNPDAVYTLLVDANPVPDPDTATTDVAGFERLRPTTTGSEPMTLTTHDDVTTTTPNEPRHRWLLAAAAAAIVLLGIGAFALTRDTTEPVEPVDEPIPTLPATPSAEEAAEATAIEYLTALYAGDADRAIAMTNADVSNTVADHNMVEMLGVAYTAGERPVVGACTTVDERTWILVSCQVTQQDPVFVELGVADLIAPIRVYDDQTIDWLPWEGGDFSQANWAYSDYLRAFHNAEFDAVCAPAAYEPGTANVNAGLALTAACAELWAPLADDVAQWIRDGRPEPTD